MKIETLNNSIKTISYCKYCGEQINNKFIFCSKCGKQIKGKIALKQKTKVRKHHSLLLDVILIFYTGGLWIIWMIFRPKYEYV